MSWDSEIKNDYEYLWNENETWIQNEMKMWVMKLKHEMKINENVSYEIKTWNENSKILLIT